MTDKGEFRLLAASDVHGSREHMDRIIEYLNNEDVAAGELMGDMSEYKNFYEADKSYYTDCLSKAKKPFLTVIGNHDTGNNEEVSASYENTKELYDAWIAPNIKYAGEVTHEDGDCYYYKDFADFGIRIIVLNQYDHTDLKADAKHFLHKRNHEMYSQRQIDFYIKALATTPGNYGVMVCLHNSPAGMIPFNLGYDSEFSSGFGVPSYISGSIIPDITEAFIKGEKGNKEYEIPTLGSKGKLKAAYDFTKRGEGEFILYLGGHYHNCLLSRVEKYPDQLLYNIDSAGIDTTTLQYSHFVRDDSLEQRDSFVVIGVNRDKKLITVTKIGTTFDEYSNEILETEFIYG